MNWKRIAATTLLWAFTIWFWYVLNAAVDEAHPSDFWIEMLRRTASGLCFFVFGMTGQTGLALQGWWDE